MHFVSIDENSVEFNPKKGIGTININGRLEVKEGVDDPVIEIFNAVQQKMQDAIFTTKKVQLVHFTPLFPSFDRKKNVTTYELVPSKPAGRSVDSFLKEAKTTLNAFYKHLFVASFKQFLEDDNEVCNYNGYSLYKICMERIEKETDPEKREFDIQTVRMLLEYFINFLGLPLPRSKEECERNAALLTLQWMSSSENWNMDMKNVHNYEKTH